VSGDLDAVNCAVGGLPADTAHGVEGKRERCGQVLLECVGVAPYLVEFVPVGALEVAADVDVGNQAEVDVFDGVFEVVHEFVVVGLAHGHFLDAVDAHQVEPDTFNVNIVDSGVREDVVDVQTQRGNLRVVDLAVLARNGDAVVLEPAVGAGACDA